MCVCVFQVEVPALERQLKKGLSAEGRKGLVAYLGCTDVSQKLRDACFRCVELSIKVGQDSDMLNRAWRAVTYQGIALFRTEVASQLKAQDAAGAELRHAYREAYVEFLHDSKTAYSST